MWRKIKHLYTRVPNSFAALDPLQLPSSLRNTLVSNVYYTPKIQKMPFTQQLARYIRYLNRKDKIDTQDLRTLTENILTQYGAIHKLQQHSKFIGQLNYGITKNYQINANELCPFHGIVDYQVWLTDTHFFPVMFCQNVLNPIAGVAMAYANMAQKSIARKDLKNSGYSIVTSGQEWQMFKVYRSFRTQKTVVYEGRNEFRNIYKDLEMIEILFGLIDECLETEREEVQVLKLAYKTLDEHKFMLEAENKEEAKKMSPISQLLLKYYKKKESFNSD